MSPFIGDDFGALLYVKCFVLRESTYICGRLVDALCGIVAFNTCSFCLRMTLLITSMTRLRSGISQAWLKEAVRSNAMMPATVYFRQDASIFKPLFNHLITFQRKNIVFKRDLANWVRFVT